MGLTLCPGRVEKLILDESRPNAALHKIFASYFGAVDAQTASTILPNAPMRDNNGRKARKQGMEANDRDWTTPQVCEICVGMEVTAYMSAEI